MKNSRGTAKIKKNKMSFCRYMDVPQEVHPVIH